MRILVILITSLSLLYAHEAGGYGGFLYSFSSPDLNKMNTDIQKNYGIKFENHYIGTGGTGWVIAGKIVLGGSGFGGSYSISNDTIKIIGKYGAGFFEPGYHLSIKKIGFDIILGIGGGNYTLVLIKGLKDASWNDILTDPQKSIELTFGGFAVQPCVRITIPIAFIGLTLKGGYSFYPIKPEWKFKYGGNVLNPPDVSLSGPYLSAGIVFGGKGGIKER